MEKTPVGQYARNFLSGRKTKNCNLPVIFTGAFNFQTLQVPQRERSTKPAHADEGTCFTEASRRQRARLRLGQKLRKVRGCAHAWRDRLHVEVRVAISDLFSSFWGVFVFGFF